MPVNSQLWTNQELVQLMKEYIVLFGRHDVIIEKLSDILLEYFENANAFEMSKVDVIKFITLNLPDEQRLILDAFESLPRNNRSPEQRETARVAQSINARVKRMFVKLKNSLFGQELPIGRVPSAEGGTYTEESVNQMTEAYEMRIGEILESTVTAREELENEKNQLAMELQQLKAQMESQAITRTPSATMDDLTAGMASASIGGGGAYATGDGATIGANGKFQIDRGEGLVNTRWSANLVRTTPQDLYETHPDTVRAVLHILESFKGKIIYDPCCGNGAMTDILQEEGHTTIGTDLFTLPIHTNFLTDELPAFDFLFMNPPFCIKREFIKKAYELGKPFLALVPLACVGTVSMGKILSENGCELNILCGQQKFYHDNRWISVGEMVWIAGNFPHIERFTQSFKSNYIGRSLLDAGDSAGFSQESDGTLYDAYDEVAGENVFVSRNPLVRGITFDPEEEMEIREPVTDEEDSLPDNTVSANDTSCAEIGFGLTCPACFEDITDESGCVLGYHCGHIMCDNCYADWRKAGGRLCPECRSLEIARQRGRPRGRAAAPTSFC